MENLLLDVKPLCMVSFDGYFIVMLSINEYFLKVEGKWHSLMSQREIILKKWSTRFYLYKEFVMYFFFVRVKLPMLSLSCWGND